jgi:hypothetical protein
VDGRAREVARGGSICQRIAAPAAYPRRVRARDLSWCLLVLAGCSFHVDCGGKGTVNAKQIEKTLTGDPAKGVAFTKVTCPDREIPAKVGTTVDCDVEVDGRATYTIRVTVSEVDGSELKFDTSYTKPFVSEKHLREKIAADAEQKLGVPVVLDCGGPLAEIPADGVVRCEATVGTLATRMLFTFDDDFKSKGGRFEDRFYVTTRVAATVTPSLEGVVGAGAVVDCGPADARPIPADRRVDCAISGADGKPRGQTSIELDENGQALRGTTALVKKP